MSTPLLFMLLVAATLQSTEAQALLDRAIAASGGADALAAATTIEWTARGTTHTGSGAESIEGRWTLQPGGAEIVTWAPGQPAASAQRTVLSGASGWSERGGVRTPLPAAVLAHERDQMYVFSLMRLLPLRETDVELSVVSPSTLLVRHPRHPDVEASFGADGRLSRLRTTISHPSTNSDIVHELTLEGSVSAGGVTWPRTMKITQDGRPSLDLEITAWKIGGGNSQLPTPNFQLPN